MWSISESLKRYFHHACCLFSFSLTNCLEKLWHLITCMKKLDESLILPQKCVRIISKVWSAAGDSCKGGSAERFWCWTVYPGQ